MGLIYFFCNFNITSTRFTIRICLHVFSTFPEVLSYCVQPHILQEQVLELYQVLEMCNRSVNESNVLPPHAMTPFFYKVLKSCFSHCGSHYDFQELVAYQLLSFFQCQNYFHSPGNIISIRCPSFLIVHQPGLTFIFFYIKGIIFKSSMTSRLVK